MQSAKEEVMQLLKELPDDSTLEEIQYHYVRQKIQRGIKDVEEGRTYTQEEMENSANAKTYRPIQRFLHNDS